MSFLQPTFLWALGLIAIPLVLHLLTRRKVQQVVLPSLMFLLGSKRRSMKLLTIRQWMVLLLRMAALASIAASFALPFISGNNIQLPWMRSPVSVHVIVDDTPSMGWEKAGVSLLDRAGTAISRIEERAGKDDEIVVESLCKRFIPAVAQHSISDILRKSDPSECQAQPSVSLRRAEIEMQESPFAEKSIILISDFQENTFSGKASDKSDIQHIAISLSPEKAGANIVVSNINTPLYPLAGEELSMCYQLSSDTSIKASPAVSLFIDGIKKGEQTADFNDSDSASDCFTMTFGEPGHHVGMIEISGDVLPSDNRRYFVFDINREIPVRILATDEAARDSGADTFYILRALRAASGAGPNERSIDIEVVSPEDIEKSLPGEGGVVILPSETAVDKKLLDVLGAFVTGGGGVFISGGIDSVSSEMVARTLFGDSIAISSGDTGESVDASSANFLTADSINSNHPLFRGPEGVSLAGDFSSAKFYSTTGIETTGPDIDVPVSFSDGSPALVERKLGSGMIIFFAAPLNPESTNLVLKPSFVPFVLELSRLLSSGSTSSRRVFNAGETISIITSLPAGEILTANEISGEQAFSLTLRTTGSSEYFSSDRPGSGAYAISIAEGMKEYLVINPDPGEGALQYLSVDRISSWFGNSAVRVVDASRNLESDEMLSAAFRTDKASLWFPLLALGVVLLLSETLLSNQRM